MKIEEARKIFKVFQEYIETADKLHKVFNIIPESFLPYPEDVLEKALNVVAKDYFDRGDNKKSESVKNAMAIFLGRCREDGEAIESMNKELCLILKDPKLKRCVIESLKDSQNSWIESRDKK